jgi:hypothetical protein
MRSHIVVHGYSAALFVDCVASTHLDYGNVKFGFSWQLSILMLYVKDTWTLLSPSEMDLIHVLLEKINVFFLLVRKDKMQSVCTCF